MEIVDPLLTEQFLMDNLRVKSVENELDRSRDEVRSEEDDHEEKPKKTE